MYPSQKARRPTVFARFSALVATATLLPVQAGIPITPGIAVGGDGACAFSSLQDAIDSIPANAGPTIIRLARNGDYRGEQILIEELDLEIRGGYTDCSDSVPDSTNTVIDADAAFTGAVITILGTSRQPQVTLRDLTIRGGNNPTSNGGGLYIDGAVVRLLSSVVTDNRALNGGGVAVNSLYQDAVLELDEGSGITNNNALGNGGTIMGLGGGISCYRAYNHPIELRLHSSSAVSSNQAAIGGGGIHSDSCSGFINSGGHGLAALVYNIGFNTASSGGGILVENTRYTTTPTTELVLGQDLAADDPRPVIANNNASALGGGVNVGIASRLRIHDAVFVNNQAGTLGGAVFAANAGDIVAERQRAHCVDDLPCIAFFDNQASSGGALAISHSSSEAQIDGAWFEGNSVTGAGSALLVENGGQATVENSVLTDNHGSSLLQVSRISHGTGQLWLLASTVSGNSSTNAVIDIDLQGSLSLGRSIIQSAVPVLGRDASNNGYQLTCNLLHEQASVAANIDAASTSLTGKNPGFVDAAGGDFHLLSIGWAVDACAASAFFNAHDHDLGARPIDAPVTNLAGPFDVGAFEWSYDLFRNGFED